MDRPIVYRQYDSRWGSISYSTKGEKTTIAKAGCGPTCAAMVIATLVDKTVTPKETCAWSLKHGFKAKNQGTFYTYFEAQFKEYGIKCQQLNGANVYGNLNASVHKKAIDELKKGNLVIAVMGKGVWTSSGHFILAHKTDGKNIYINDPASEKAMRECNSIATWQHEVKYYWVIEVPKAKKGDDEVVEKRKIDIFGKEYECNAIFKDNANYISPKVLAEAGFSISNIGSKAQINMSDIPVLIRERDFTVKGINSNGTVYVGLRELLELIGLQVDWDEGKVVIK